MSNLSGRLSSPPAPVPRMLESPSPKQKAAVPSRSSGSTTVIRSPEDLLEALHNDVDAKIESARATHHMTYGVLLRELERAVRERHESDAAVVEAQRKQSAAESAMAHALARARDLEQELQRSLAAHAETERSMLQWQQRCEALHGDIAVLKRDLERAVHDADHNRQLLAMEVRSRSHLLTSMHDDILKRRTVVSALAVGEQESGGGGGSSGGGALVGSGGGPTQSAAGSGALTSNQGQASAETTAPVTAAAALDTSTTDVGIMTSRRWSPTRNTRQAEVSPVVSRLSLLTSPPPLPHESAGGQQRHSVGRSLLNGWVSSPSSVSMHSPSATGSATSHRPSWLR